MEDWRMALGVLMGWMRWMGMRTCVVFRRLTFLRGCGFLLGFGCRNDEIDGFGQWLAE